MYFKKFTVEDEPRTQYYLLTEDQLLYTASPREVIKIEDKYVIHFVAMPDAKIKDTNKLIMSIYKRCLKIFGKEITSQFVFNKRNEFPLSGCGKRNNIALTEEGIPNNSLIVVSGLGIENYIVENNKKKIKKL